ncbi:hypothetical protein DESUT3_05870 [Desulfuromonas versatilis]|uniref:Uncharacterized protein n=1 Tax=Desulfuromonas versatilis TaxID=2802975 RepID=A0ABN6DTR9_9BACT|nr:hypothetical protein [Desulfuromonas versatilis]BCR03518.1 hypothetical protein DESUT3_05870 [Desulfuromonas versatilis]
MTNIAEKLLANAPEDMDLKARYGLTEVPSLPVVDMAVKEARLDPRQ